MELFYTYTKIIDVMVLSYLCNKLYIKFCFAEFFVYICNQKRCCYAEN